MTNMHDDKATTKGAGQSTQDLRVPPKGGGDIEVQIQEYRKLVRTGKRQDAIVLLWKELCGPVFFDDGDVGRFNTLLAEVVEEPKTGLALPMHTDQDVKACTLLANCRRLMGPATAAVRLHSAVVAWDKAHSQGAPALRALRLDLLGLDLLATGDYPQAEACFKQSLILAETALAGEQDDARKADVLANVVTAHRDLAALYTATGQWERVVAELARARSILVEAEFCLTGAFGEVYNHNVLRYEASVWITLAEAALRLGAIMEARHATDRAWTCVERSKGGRERIDVTLLQGLVQMQSGFPEQAVTGLQAADEGARKRQRTVVVARATVARAGLAAANAPSRAKELLENALTLAVVNDYVGIEAEIHLALARHLHSTDRCRSRKHAELAALRSKQHKDPTTREYVLNVTDDGGPWCDSLTLAGAELMLATDAAREPATV